MIKKSGMHKTIIWDNNMCRITLLSGRILQDTNRPSQVSSMRLKDEGWSIEAVTNQSVRHYMKFWSFQIACSPTLINFSENSIYLSLGQLLSVRHLSRHWYPALGHQQLCAQNIITQALSRSTSPSNFYFWNFIK